MAVDRVQALIHQEKFDEALKIIADVSEKEQTTVEKAYIFYRLNRNDEALDELKNTEEDDPAALELKAQLFYRLNRFQEAYDIYRKLCRDLEDDEYEDLRRANLLAVKAKLHESGVEQEPTTSGLDTHEQLYNHACHLVACKRYEEASKILQQALETAKKNLKADGLSQKEISDEVKPIKAQIKFANHELGTKDEAKIARRKLRKRKRKIRLPKNYDPNVPPDPERWLPKHERSAYKKKVNKKFKDRNVGRGTQGAAATANTDKIDYSNTAPKEATQSPKPTPPAPEGPRQQHPAGGQRRQQQKKKKKGGGGKW